MLAARLIPLPVQNLAAAVVLGKPKNPGPRRRTVRPPGDLDSAWRSFLAWVSCHLSVDPVSLFVCCPILAAMALQASGNHLYCNGGSKHTFRHTLVGAPRAILTLRGCLAPAWEILSRWEAAEPTIHRTPLPEPLLRAMICIAWLGGFRRWCGCALLAFYGMARIGEVLSCERRHLLLPEDLFDFSPSVFLRLDSSKTSLRGRPKVQHIRVDDSDAQALIKLAFADLSPADELFPFSQAAFRSRWDRCLAALGLRGLHGHGDPWRFCVEAERLPCTTAACPCRTYNGDCASSTWPRWSTTCRRLQL